MPEAEVKSNIIMDVFSFVASLQIQTRAYELPFKIAHLNAPHALSINNTEPF